MQIIAAESHWTRKSTPAGTPCPITKVIMKCEATNACDRLLSISIDGTYTFEQLRRDKKIDIMQTLKK
jgi:hypothetical protein